MFDYEGSRGEFLKLLAECGEEPAFIARARAPQVALDALLNDCKLKYEEMLKWPAFHLSVLAHRVGKDWSRLGRLLANPESVSLLATLHANLPSNLSAQANWLTSDRSALRRFLESAERFNRNWLAHLEGLDLVSVNKPRHDFNQFYALEMACAFGNERVTKGIEPLGLIDSEYLQHRFPLLKLPRPA
jgi:hypothetical protein